MHKLDINRKGESNHIYFLNTLKNIPVTKIKHKQYIPCNYNEMRAHACITGMDGQYRLLNWLAKNNRLPTGIILIIYTN